MNQVFDAAFWDRKYSHHQGPWDGEPNAVLAESLDTLTPGTALDLGCGEGADALWLAKRGWKVTAVDVSQVGLDRARAADTEQQVTWLQADMYHWEPPVEAFDLVSAHYVHMPPAERAGIFGRLGRATRPGGMILVVAHHPSDLETQVGRPPIPDLYFTAEEVVALLPGQWEVIEGGTRPHAVTNREGQTLTIQDMVLKARRLPV